MSSPVVTMPMPPKARPRSFRSNGQAIMTWYSLPDAKNCSPRR